MCVLPAKDTVEEVFWKETGMSKKINALVTLGIVTLCYCLAIFIPEIGDAITIAGSTTNPVVNYSMLYIVNLDRIYTSSGFLLESNRG